MSFDEAMAVLQSFEAPFLGQMTPEFALFALSVAFFGLSTAVCAMAVKASSGARDAREDARLMMRTVQDYAVEVRQLTAKAENLNFAASQEPQEGLSNRLQGVRVGSRNDTDEASLTVEEGGTEVDAAGADDDANARLADATRAATEPRSLLSGMLRRR